MEPWGLTKPLKSIELHFAQFPRLHYPGKLTKLIPRQSKYAGFELVDDSASCVRAFLRGIPAERQSYPHEARINILVHKTEPEDAANQTHREAT